MVTDDGRVSTRGSVRQDWTKKSSTRIHGEAHAQQRKNLIQASTGSVSCGREEWRELENLNPIFCQGLATVMVRLAVQDFCMRAIFDTAVS
jgi:hypothetical protein